MRFSNLGWLAIIAACTSFCPAVSRGGWPVVDSSGSAIHCMNSTYGVRDYDGGTFHDGVDICMRDHTDRVRAVTGGTVRASQSVSDIGYFIAIEENASSWHYYWHLGAIAGVTPAVNAVVSAGDVLGGQWTGRLGYHCHYSHFPHHQGAAPAARASRQAWSEHPFREIGAPFGSNIRSNLWWYGMPLKCHWEIFDYGYQFNGFRLIDVDQYRDIVVYDADYPFKQNCCSDPRGDYDIGNGVDLIPAHFQEGAQPSDARPKVYDVQFDCLMHHWYQICISQQPSYAIFAGCDEPVSNEEEEDVRAFVDSGMITVIGREGCSGIELLKVEWTSDLAEPRRTLDMHGTGLCEPGLQSDPVGQHSQNYVTVVVRKDNGIVIEMEFVLLLGKIKPPSLAASPNPFVNQTEVRLDIGPGGAAAPTAVDIYDLSGRLVRTIEGGRMDGFAVQWRWDGRDHGGRAVAAGVYLASINSDRSVSTARIMKLR